MSDTDQTRTAQPKPVKVRLRTQDASEAQRMADDLARLGLQVRHVLAPIGVITGELDESLFDAVQAAPGVQAIEPEPDYQLPPDPDAPQ